MSEMVERVARAIAAKHDANWNGDIAPWDDLTDHWKEMYRTLARAAIEAMKEPTEAMVDAGSNELAGFDWEHGTKPIPSKAVWRDMIDAALGEND